MRELRRDRLENKRFGHGGDEQPQTVYTAKYKVTHSGELLDFLLTKCNTSRNNVKNLLSNHQVLVNGSVVTQYNFPLAREDEVKIAKNPVRGNVKKVEVKRDFKHDQSVKPILMPKIIYEDDDFIAIDKPAGLLSVESDKSTECAFGMMLDYLQKRDKNIRPFVLHRIDKETSGVLVFAKNIKLHSMMRLNWNDFVKTREYVAIVEGVMENKENTIVTYLKENKNNMVYSTHDPSGQKAITHYRTIKENEKFSMLSVKIDTGRKNQIRVHMQELGHPVVGDEKYGFTKDPLKRLGLHASVLEFTHPTSGELIKIRASLPASFNALFAKKPQ